MKTALRSWGTCLDCGYEGMLEYIHVEGEVYDDCEALGVMMMLRCPACGSEDHTLIDLEYYREMREAQNGES